MPDMPPMRMSSTATSKGCFFASSMAAGPSSAISISNSSLKMTLRDTRGPSSSSTMSMRGLLEAGDGGASSAIMLNSGSGRVEDKCMAGFGMGGGEADGNVGAGRARAGRQNASQVHQSGFVQLNGSILQTRLHVTSRFCTDKVLLA